MRKVRTLDNILLEGAIIEGNDEIKGNSAEITDRLRRLRAVDIDAANRALLPTSLKLFAEFLEELSDISDMPDRMWPIACRYAARLYEAYGNEIKVERIKASKKATDARYEETRAVLAYAKNVALKQWSNGSSLKHHQMKKYLIEEYQDENGKHPFLNLSEKSLLEICKKVALEIKRPDLISGKK